MARGWESKSVEEQISHKESLKVGASPPKSAEEIKALQERKSLELAIAKLRADLARATNVRHRAMLEAATIDLERKLDALDKISG
ncbi:MAG: hypothetical protein HYX26_05140 [Acidobacteriales bacterium]|nr:hypothetical protein [Terriglobales bacterium]